MSFIEKGDVFRTHYAYILLFPEYETMLRMRKNYPTYLLSAKPLGLWPKEESLFWTDRLKEPVKSLLKESVFLVLEGDSNMGDFYKVLSDLGEVGWICGENRHFMEMHIEKIAHD